MLKRAGEWCALLIGGFFLLSLGKGAYPQEDQCTPGITTSQDQVRGRVNGIDERFLSVVYKQQKNALYAITFLVDDTTKVKNKAGISQIERGDIVRVEYEQVRECQDGRLHLRKRYAKKIEYIKQEVDFQSIKLQRQ